MKTNIIDIKKTGVMLFFLSVELLAQIPHFIAVGLGGMFCLLFQSLDFLLTLGEFGLKSLGLASGEAIGGSRLARLLLSFGGDDWYGRDMEVGVCSSMCR